MGKRKKEKKGKGAEKTAMKTEKNAGKKTKKMLKEQGEDDIESIIAQFKEEDRKKTQVIEETSSSPSLRSNMTMCAHPDKDELIIFGGQYCNGARTSMFNDLFTYNIKHNEWTKITAPNAPPPRCSHQAVILRQGGGQMWIFGGEFESPKQLQFYHYNDLWVFHLRDKLWEKINAKGGPSSRSGHRMVACKKQLMVFGGFHDVGGDYRYFNDVYAFNLETYTWSKLQPSGTPPAPRSGCVVGTLQDQNKMLIYGGYSREKIKKDVDQGIVHEDMFLLVPDGKEKDSPIPSKWKWVAQKQGGMKPSRRCGVSLIVTPANRALVYGGVNDEEDEEEMNANFFDDLYSLELDTGKWHQIFLREKDKEKKKRRRKKLDSENSEQVLEDGEDVDEDVKRLKVCEDSDVEVSSATGQISTFDDGVFSVTVAAPSASSAKSGIESEASAFAPDEFWPSARMNAALALKNGTLYMYGGLSEVGDKQLTLCDMYSLDLHKLDEWKVLMKGDTDQEWFESEDSEDTDDEEVAAISKKSVNRDNKMDENDSSESEDDDEDDESDMELGEAPLAKKGESLDDYFSRNKDYWMLRADEVAEKDGLDVNTKMLKKAARKMAEEFLNEQNG